MLRCVDQSSVEQIYTQWNERQRGRGGCQAKFGNQQLITASCLPHIIWLIASDQRGIHAGWLGDPIRSDFRRPVNPLGLPAGIERVRAMGNPLYAKLLRHHGQLSTHCFKRLRALIRVHAPQGTTAICGQQIGALPYALEAIQQAVQLHPAEAISGRGKQRAAWRAALEHRGHLTQTRDKTGKC